MKSTLVTFGVILLIVIGFVFVFATSPTENCPTWPPHATNSTITKTAFTDPDTTFVQLSFHSKFSSVNLDGMAIRVTGGWFGVKDITPLPGTGIFQIWLPPIKNRTICIYQIYCAETGFPLKNGSFIIFPKNK